MKTFRTNTHQRAFTLIELMIAMLIGVFLMAGVIQIFLSAKQAYRLQENLSRLQENGRFAMDFITKDVRMAGYAGCSSKVTPNSILDPAKITAPALTSGMNGVDGVNVTTSSWNSVANALACGTTPANQCVAGTDVISIQSASSCGGQLQNDVSDTAQLDIVTPNECGLAQDDIAIVASCTSVDIFSISNAQGDSSLVGNGKQNLAHGAGKFNLVPKLGSTYSKNDAEVLVPRLFSYYIRTGAGGIPSLYRVNNIKPASSTNPVELIEGIEDMQILYGVDTEQTPDYIPNYYVDAAAVANIKIPATGPLGTIATNDSNGALMNPAPSAWTRVVSVRISLLAVTIDNNLTDEPQPYFYNGTTITKANLSASGSKAISVLKTDTSQLCPPSGTNCQPADDRRLHRVFSSTIAIRNRLP